MSTAPHLKVLEEAFRPLCQDPDDADTVVEEVVYAAGTSLKVVFQPLLEKLVPYKFTGDEYMENGREFDNGGSYWYTVKYPDRAYLRWAVKLDLEKRWAKATSVPAVTRNLRKGASAPTLDGPLQHAFYEVLRERILDGKDLPNELGREDEEISTEMENTILAYMASDPTYEDTVRQLDTDGEPVAEAGSIEIFWEMRTQELKISTEEQGSMMRVAFDLPVKVDIRKILAPGDWGWGRRAAMKITMGEVASRLKKEPFRLDRRDQSYETRMASFYSLNIHQQRHTGTKKEQFLVVWYTGNPAHRWSSKTVDTLKDAVALANQVKPESDLATATEMGETPEGKLARRFLATFSRPGRT